MTPLKILKRDFLSFTNWIRYEPGLQGQRVKDGVVFVGNRAGPTRAFSYLAHELSHFVEIDDARQQSHNWGLKVPTLVVLGQTCTQNTTRQMTERELRVMAYQANLMEAIGAPARIPEMVRALQFMPDFFLVPLEDGRPAYGEGAPSRDEVPYRDVDLSRTRWMVNRVQELRKEYTFERFQSEWTRKIALLGPPV
jgi:hypothetical protein